MMNIDDLTIGEAKELAMAMAKLSPTEKGD
jgi:hypothetical protein